MVGFYRSKIVPDFSKPKNAVEKKIETSHVGRNPLADG